MIYAKIRIQNQILFAIDNNIKEFVPVDLANVTSLDKASAIEKVVGGRLIAIISQKSI